MFGSSNNNNAKTNSALPKVAVDNFEAYIGKSTQITGNITAQGSIRIDGTFSGIVSAALCFRKAMLLLVKPAILKPIFLAPM